MGYPIKPRFLKNIMEEAMECPYLNNWRVVTCIVNNKLYIPSLFELEEYCKTKSHKKCPFLLRNTDMKREVDGLISA